MDRNGQPWGKVEANATRLLLSNVCFNLKQLIGVLRCDLQVAIHEGLIEVQDDLLEVIANFMDNFLITVTMLSAPQVHALLDHMCARHAGSHSFLAAIRRGTTLHTHSLTFFNRLPDHQINIERGSTHPMDVEMEVSHFSRILQTDLVDMTSNPALMLDFNCGVKDVPTVDLTKEVTLLRIWRRTWRCLLQPLALQLTNQPFMMCHPKPQFLLQMKNDSLLSHLGDLRPYC